MDTCLKQYFTLNTYVIDYTSNTKQSNLIFILFNIIQLQVNPNKIENLRIEKIGWRASRAVIPTRGGIGV